MKPTYCLTLSALALLCAVQASAVDLAPPEVPNPYGTSEGRAIRDHLEEAFKLKASDKLSLEELRALYRKTWNAEQEQRYLEENAGRPADPAWVKAYTLEREQEQRTKWIGVLAKLGVTAPPDASIDQLRDLAAKTSREQEEAADQKRRAETEKLREEVAKQNAAVAAAEPRGTSSETGFSRGGAANGSVGLTPIIGEKEIISDDAIRTAVRLTTTMPNKSEVERQKIEKYADGIIATRKDFIAKRNAKAILTSGSGIEIWRGVQPDPSDPEKEFASLFILNITTENLKLHSAEYLFAASARNTDGKTTFSYTNVWPCSTCTVFLVTYYKDPGQIFSVGEVVIAP